GDPMVGASLVETVRQFFDLLEQRRVRYVLVGGVALLYYVEGRNTQDLDLLMAAPSLTKLPELKVVEQDENFARASFGGLTVDLLLTRNPLFKRVYAKYTTEAQLLDRTVPIATVDGLLLLKLYELPSLYRQGNFARVGIYENDIATLIHYYRPNVDGLLDELSRYLAEPDLAEVRKVVAELQRRADRFRGKESSLDQ
ncbi:MAG: hypothetical protein RMN53_17220, partial [Anaerolineae bacterium]|nr:hypothetical protein [Anaerolineae bacterium]